MATGDYKNGTALTGKILTQGQAGTSAAAVYTVAANQYVKFAKVVLCNESASGVTASYGVCPSGATAGAAGTFAGKAVSLGASGSSTATVELTELDGAMLGPADFLWFSASAGTSVTYTVSGAVSA